VPPPPDKPMAEIRGRFPPRKTPRIHAISSPRSPCPRASVVNNPQRCKFCVFCAFCGQSPPSKSLRALRVFVVKSPRRAKAISTTKNAKITKKDLTTPRTAVSVALNGSLTFPPFLHKRKIMTICLENPVFDQLQISSSKIMADLALGLYADNQLTLKQAADLAEMTPAEFHIFAGNCGIPVNYDLDDLNHDLAVLRERGIT